MNFTESVTEFLAQADWLNASHAPSVTALIAMAAKLDEEVTPAMLAQYSAVHRYLMKEKPRVYAEVDPLAELLRR
jgi:precorrin-4 methylase